MPRIKEIAGVIERLAPLALQEDYDNSGLVLGSPDEEVDACLICLDVTEDIVDEAITRSIPMIISHHPVIFNKINRITGSNITERIIIKAIRAGISIYSAHTNLDSVDKGVSYILGLRLGLKGMRVLRKSKGLLRKLVTFCPTGQAENVRQAIFEAGGGHIGNYDSCSFNTSGFGTFRGNDETNPYVGEPGKLHVEEEVRIETIFPFYLEREVIRALLQAHPYEEVAYDIYGLENEYDRAGMGIMGELPEMMEETEFLQMLKVALNIPCIRHSKLTGRKVKKVSLCGGSGSFLIPDALKQKADFFITGDIKYHQFQLAAGEIVIADIGHFESEQFTCGLLAEELKKNFPNFAIQISEKPVNPVNYF
jgi:dinuclear metal center YbgI/SA1388 family protein